MRRALIAALLFWPSAAHAYRPFDGTDADVAAAGEFELEIGAFGWLHQDRQRSLVAPTLVAHYGVLPRLELVLEGRQFVFIDWAPGQSRVQLLDNALSVKFVLREGTLQEQSGPSVAVEASMLLPETGTTRPGGQLAGIVSQQWSNLTVHGNGAVALTRENSLEVFVGAIVEGPGRWLMRPVGEAFVDHDSAGTVETSALGGAIVRLSEGLSLDAALRGARVDDRSAIHLSWEVRAGLTWGFEVFARRPT